MIDKERLQKLAGVLKEHVVVPLKIPSKIENEGKGMINTSDHPEDHNYQVPHSWDQPDGLFEDEEESKIHRALIGREFQTLDDVAKMYSRLQQAGYSPEEVKQFIFDYISQAV